MMKNYTTKTVFVATVLFFQFGYAQVGIGTTNPLSALHVQGTARVTQTNNVTTTTKLTGTDTAGVICDIKVGPNLFLNNNELSAAGTDNSYYKVAQVPLTHSTSNYLYNDINLDLNGVNAGKVVFRLSGTTHNFTIGGISGGSDGRHIILFNATGGNMKVEDLATSTSADANRINTTGSSTATSGVGTMELVYDAASQKWIVVGIRD